MAGVIFMVRRLVVWQALLKKSWRESFLFCLKNCCHWTSCPQAAMFTPRHTLPKHPAAAKIQLDKFPPVSHYRCVIDGCKFAAISLSVAGM
ncbi:MAG: hypothetical protein ONB48_19940 [candidate division KSB1 bacterium]|nr:hypothetical protein [candidate division KSB1 bacterium]MDZ7276276.1 hypothetical protein [candidate division KSB1 bacterium]MDZ7287918.1 hypothetical protein [candidate division KSB1 bacterium]MDZ7300069.1 hypothetical protein [candidate division KSB1 bacterium]MDZ7307311.1 hypothetical protein [candidate division KSB1 bacterium]